MKEEINDELNILNSSLAGSKVGMPYNVPEGYFSELAHKVLQTDEADGSNNIPMHTAMPYLVPPKYFDGLASQVIEKAAPQKKKAVLLSFTTIRWAAAAMLLVMVGTAVIVSMNRQRTGVYNVNSRVVVADRDIEAYFADNTRPEVALLPDITYLTSTDVQAKEIIYYLDQTGWDTEYYN